MFENLKVAIIGAGLGGLAVAIALQKKGINAQVYDKAHQLRPAGAGLSLFSNGLNALEAIQARASQPEFDHWLYNYNLSGAVLG